jgi:hypothetical protein
LYNLNIRKILRRIPHTILMPDLESHANSNELPEGPAPELAAAGDFGPEVTDDVGLRGLY